MAVVILLHISFLVYIPYTREDFSLVHYVYLALLGFILQHFPVLFVSLSCKNCLPGKHTSASNLFCRNTGILMISQVIC